MSFIKFDIKAKAYEGIIIESKDNYFIVSNVLERYYVYNAENEYEIGDVVRIISNKEKLDFTRLEGEFDFEEYLDKKGVNYSLKNTNIQLKFKNMVRINYLKRRFLSHFSDESKSLIASIFFGSNSYDSKIKDNMTALHISRLINASGIYVYFFLKILTTLLGYRLNDKKARLIAIIFLFPYLIFTFPKYSVIKITLFSFLKWLNDYVFKIKISYLGLLSIFNFSILLIDYHLAYQDAFILGFMIPVTSYMINSLLSGKPKYKKLILAIFIFFLFIPFEIKFFDEIAPLSYFYQILLTPFFIIFSLLGMISFIGIPIYSLIDSYVSFLDFLLTILKGINIVIFVPKMNEYLMTLYFICYYGILYFHEAGFPHHRTFLIVFASITFIIDFSPINHYIKEEVYFINVGQGDSTLIRKGETAVLIDTGGNIKKDIAKEVLIPFFKNRQIYDLDLVITTHDDYDHMGALSSLYENFMIRNYIKMQDDFPIKIGKLEINNYNYRFDDEDKNFSSLVLSFHFANKDFLIMGDAPKEIEREIMDNYSYIPCDILKVGHHGSNTSSDDKFISYLSPKEAVISCGRNNKYGHPNKEVIDTLNKHHVKIRRTDIEGTISYYSYAIS